MRLWIKQKIFSWNDRFAVKNEEGVECFLVEGEFFSFGKRLHIMSADGQEVAMVQQKIWSFLPRFYISVGGEPTAEIVKKMTLFYPRYTIEGLNWEINGDFFDHDYVITQKGIPVVSINKAWMTWGDCYMLDINESSNVVSALAVVLAIDCVAAQANTNT
ncbi:MAG: LURP-one-related family protein [Oscillospiraceae bacterium]